MRVSVDPLARRQVDRSKAAIVVSIGPVDRRQPLEQRREIGQEQRLVLIEQNRRGRVQALNIDQASWNARLSDVSVHAFCEVDELGGPFGHDSDSSETTRRRGCKGFHGSSRFPKHRLWRPESLEQLVRVG